MWVSTRLTKCSTLFAGLEIEDVQRLPARTRTPAAWRNEVPVAQIVQHLEVVLFVDHLASDTALLPLACSTGGNAGRRTAKYSSIITRWYALSCWWRFVRYRAPLLTWAAGRPSSSSRTELTRFSHRLTGRVPAGGPNCSSRRSSLAARSSSRSRIRVSMCLSRVTGVHVAPGYPLQQTDPAQEVVDHLLNWTPYPWTVSSPQETGATA